jgi:3-deoxy-D-manno-octulosonic-acid transferase
MIKIVWQFIYYFLITPLVLIIAHGAALFSSKIRKGLYPRYRSIRLLRKWVADLNRNDRRLILFHAASMGEFEHIKPLLVELKRRYDTVNIITLFSPSAYEHIKETEGLDFHLYMPFDTPANWKELYGLINPSMIVLAKYDVWPAQIWMAKKMAIPLFLVNATLKVNSSRTNFGIRHFLGYVYRDIENIFATSNEDTERIVQNFPNCRVEVLGDTKYDQVIIRKRIAQSKKLIPASWIAKNKIIVAGSIWPEDEDHLFPALLEILENYSDVKLILVPHVPDDKSIKRISNYFIKWPIIQYTHLNKIKDERILIIDSVGLLAEIYKYANMAYVGGGFRKKGLHNVMEPAIYGIPVLYGPLHENSYEAMQLADKNGGIVADNFLDFLKAMELLLTNEEERINLGKKAEKYATRNTGATDQLLLRWEKTLSENIT